MGKKTGEERNSGHGESYIVEVKHALRVLAREKAFAAFAILTLALGIGAVTAIFSVVDGVLLKPLAYRESGRLYAATESAPQLARIYPRLPVNASHFHSWQEQCRSCESAALLNPASFNLTGDGEPERIEGATCTWPLFQVLGVEPQLGRTFVEERRSTGRQQIRGDQRLTLAPAAGGRSGCNRASRSGSTASRMSWSGCCAPDFRFPSGEQIGPLNQFPKHAEIFKPMGINWAKVGRVGSVQLRGLIRLRPDAIRREPRPR